MKKHDNALRFTLWILPIAAVAGYFTALYQIQMLDAATLAQVIAELGSQGAMIAVYILQTVVYAGISAFVGYIFSSKLGLMRPVRFQKKQTVLTLAVSLIGGVLLSLDYWTFGKWIDGVREATDLTMNIPVVLASVLYGGVVEELMLRLFLMSLTAWLIWKVAFGKQETAPTAAIVAANVLSALLFAAGHLPATQLLFGQLTPLLLLRCFLLNGGAGILFGFLYRKHGIQYAMLSHALLHIVSKLIWFVFL